MVRRYMLRLEGGDPADPAVFVSDRGSWVVGDSFTAGDGSRWRILAADAPDSFLIARDFWGVWTVEPLD